MRTEELSWAINVIQSMPQAVAKSIKAICMLHVREHSLLMRVGRVLLNTDLYSVYDHISRLLFSFFFFSWKLLCPWTPIPQDTNACTSLLSPSLNKTLSAPCIHRPLSFRNQATIFGTTLAADISRKWCQFHTGGVSRTQPVSPPSCPRLLHRV